MALKYFFIDDDELLDNLIEKIREGVLQKDKMDYLTYVKGKMTNYRFFSEGKGKEEFEKIKAYFPQYNMTDVWGNIYNRGDYADEHHHLNYDVKYSHGDYATSGIIYLTDSEIGTVFTKLGFTEKAERGKVVFFSPEELHEVPTVEEDERITIGFNAYDSYAR